MREWTDLVARLRVLDAEEGEEFGFHHGAKTCSVEAPRLLNLIWQVHFSPLVTSWEQRGLGFRLDDEGPALTHAIWGDNLWIFAASWGQAAMMLGEATEGLVNALRMCWKVAS